MTTCYLSCCCNKTSSTFVLDDAYDKSKDIDDITKIKVWTHGDTSAERQLPEASVHEQSDSTVLACCATGTSSKDSLFE